MARLKIVLFKTLFNDYSPSEDMAISGNEIISCFIFKKGQKYLNFSNISLMLTHLPIFVYETVYSKGREPWSSGYGKRLTFLWSWVRIPAPYTGWAFFHIYLL